VDGATFLALPDDDLRAPPPDGLGLSGLQIARVRKEIKAACPLCL
jgi:hypothetical protein